LPNPVYAMHRPPGTFPPSIPCMDEGPE
jgi:hypothetical protein